MSVTNVSEASMLAKIKFKPLSDEEILDLCDNKARLVTHDEIPKFKNINHLLGPNKAVIILYVTKSGKDGSVFGHWCCCFKAGWQSNTICFFDPYGKPPDNALQYIEKDTLPKYPDYPYLTEMLRGSGYDVVYNSTPLQNKDPKDNICGRLTGLRLLARDVDGIEFARFLNQFKPYNFDGDDLATYLTSFLR